jgi:LmbE family N-acetylglucosaminyl deacetylase
VALLMFRCISKARLRTVIVLLVTVIYLTPIWAQRELSGAARTQLDLDRLCVTGSVLMIAAHPDDENTALLTYLARGRKVRTGYLSLTRGEGGQNLIGPEQGDALGVIRTQELLAARRIDGAEQFFSRAVDFGFTKTPKEALDKWGHDKILSDVVWVIRRFRPDVIILRFSGTPRDGHGHHQASAILGKEAFFAAADPARSPEQLRWVEPWQAKRLMWNMAAFNRQQQQEAEKQPNKLTLDPGEYDPVLGHSYSEIAGMSRSMHRSQGMGTAERRGSDKNYVVTVAGEPAVRDIFDGVDITWNRIPGGGPIGQVLAEADRTFRPEKPEATVPLLIKAKKMMAELHQPVVDRKRQEIQETIALCSGLWLDATADKFAVVPGGMLKIKATALSREHVPVQVASVTIEGIASALDAKGGALAYNEARNFTAEITVPRQQPLSQPYWLREPRQGDIYIVPNQLEIGLAENPPLFEAKFQVRVDTEDFEITRPVVYRYVERAQGELTRPVIVEPAVALEWSESALLFPNGSAKKVELQLKSNTAGATGPVRIQAPAGWHVAPASEQFRLAMADEESSLALQINPPSQDAQEFLGASATVGDQNIAVGMQTISYPHIPPQILFPPAKTKLVRADIRLLAKTIGYVMGAGDEVPGALRQLGAEVSLLGPEDLARGNLARFDAIVTGVRAYNTRPDLRANEERLLEYVRNGGTMVVQYNVPEGGGPGANAPAGTPAPGRGPSAPAPDSETARGNAPASDGGAAPNNAPAQETGNESPTLAHIGPYLLTTGRDRVTMEDAPVQLPNPMSPLLHKPNQITAHDFEGWVQERGLNFASKWDPHYQSLFETHDPGEKPLLGGTLYTRYGKGAYVFTAASWFRQLPAGVPGAFRIFVNLLSAGKTL